MRTIACLLLLCAALPGVTQAQEARTYVGARIGHITLEDVDDDGSFNVGVLGGVFFGPGFSAEGSLDFQESEFAVEVGGIVIGTEPIERKTIALQFGLSATPFPWKPVRPYAAGGFGHYFSEYAFDGGSNDRVSEWGWYAGGGIEFMGDGWRDGVSVSLEMRRLFTENEEPGDSEVRADGRIFSAGFRYKF